MALRFLAVKLTKALLPLRAPAGSRAFATAPKPKGHPSTKICEEVDPTKYYRPKPGSFEEKYATFVTQLQQDLRLSFEGKQKANKLNERILAVTGIGGLGSIGYVASIVGSKTA